MAKFRIKELAQAQGIENAPELSRAAKIGQTTAYKLWDNSTYKPNVDTLLSIAEVLGVSLDDLVIRGDNGSPDNQAQGASDKIRVPALLAANIMPA